MSTADIPRTRFLRRSARQDKAVSQQLTLGPTKLQLTMQRAESDWQRMVLTEWGRQNPKPAQMWAGYLGWLDIVPTLCTCTKCDAPSLIIPDPNIEPERGFVLCPNCSVPKVAEATL